MATKAEKSHLGKVAALGCIVCRNLGYGQTPAECHHARTNLTGMGRKSSDYLAIPLCHRHHRTGGYGVAYHAGPEEWERRYGTQQELLEQTLKELEINDGVKK